MAKLILVRHLPAGVHWAGRCYGQSDVGLARQAMRARETLVADLAAFLPDVIYSSHLRRARWLAGHASRCLGKPLVVDARLAECHFGSWEGRAWDAIWRDTGSSMIGMIDAPGAFRPGGGETTFELRDRAMDWLGGLPPGKAVLAVSHGGPIAAIAGTLRGLPVREWPSLVPRTGTWMEFEI